MTLYEFITVNRNKRRGPFLIRRHGVPIGMRASLNEAKAAAKRSEQIVAEAIRKALAKAEPQP